MLGFLHRNKGDGTTDPEEIPRSKEEAERRLADHGSVRGSVPADRQAQGYGHEHNKLHKEPPKSWKEEHGLPADRPLAESLEAERGAGGGAI